MANQQMPLPDSEDEILTQAQAIRLTGLTRPTFRGMLDRGEIKTLDRKGPKGAARVSRADVLRAMAERGETLPTAPVESCGAPSCRDLQAQVRRLTEELARKSDDLARARRMLDAAWS